jgi:hypothetical protein
LLRPSVLGIWDTAQQLNRFLAAARLPIFSNFSGGEQGGQIGRNFSYYATVFFGGVFSKKCNVGTVKS